MPLDVTIAWTWILAGALISALGIFLTYRRAGLAATYICVGGLLLLAASAFGVHPALLRSSLPQDVHVLQDELSEAKRKASLEQDGLVTEKTKAARLEQSANATANDLAATKAAAAACWGDNKALAEQLEAEKAAHRSVLQSYQTQQTLLEANLAHVRLLESEKAALVKQLSAKEREITDAQKPAAQLNGQALNLNARDAAREARKAQFVLAGSPKLGIKKLETSELVQGEIGDYYLISLKDAQTGSPIIFPPAQFIITGEAEQLHSAMDEFREAVLKRVPPDWQYRIFVRGYADGGSFKEPVGDDFYRDLEFLPPSDSSRSSYRSQSMRKHLGGEFENADLPNLRGVFLARTLHASIKGALPVVLGNSPEAGTNKASRRADIILLLKRPNG